MKKYDVYGIGAAIVDIEVVVNDHFLSKNKVEKGIMTLVDEERQHQLINALTSQKLLSNVIAVVQLATALLPLAALDQRHFIQARWRMIGKVIFS